MHARNIEKPFILTIYGASGDLAYLKLFSSMYAIAEQKRFPKDYHIVGFGRTHLSKKEFRARFEKGVRDNLGYAPREKVLQSLLRHVYYFQGEYNNLESFKQYKSFRNELCASKPHTRIEYFSVPPALFGDIVRNLAATKKSKKEDIRLIMEKPFGRDKASAEQLFHFVSQYFSEDQFYLLDHYLGKSSVQSILNMRHTNRILSNIMRGEEIANIQITAFETTGVENRIDYFEETGIVRDFIQSHLLQIFALVTMNIPNHHEADSLQREKMAMLEAADCMCDGANVVLGQYKSYRKQKKVSRGSKTETFAAVRLLIDKQDWHGVPIYIRTGKKLKKKSTYVVIEFKKFPFQSDKEAPNRIIIEFSPFPKITLQMINFQEGIDTYQHLNASASIACDIEGCLPEHADLILDAINKQKLHFLSFGEIMASWDVVDEIANNIQQGHISVTPYADHSNGPAKQHMLTKKDGFEWVELPG